MAELTVADLDAKRTALIGERRAAELQMKMLKRQIAGLNQKGQLLAAQLNHIAGGIETLDAFLGAAEPAAEAKPEPTAPAPQ